MAHPQTMRDRLREVAAEGIARGATPAELVDDFLFTLQDRDIAMVRAGLREFALAMADQPRPGILADAFSAMIAEVRAENA